MKTGPGPACPGEDSPVHSPTWAEGASIGLGVVKRGKDQDEDS